MWQCNRSTLNSFGQQSVSSCSLYSLRFSFFNIIMFCFVLFCFFTFCRCYIVTVRMRMDRKAGREKGKHAAKGHRSAQPGPLLSGRTTCGHLQTHWAKTFLFFQFQSKKLTLSSQEKASSAGQRGSPLNLHSPGLQILNLLPPLSQNPVSSRTDNFTASVVLWHAQKLMLV